MDDIFEEDDTTMEFKDKLHWYNAQKKWLKKKEFWRAVIYALTRPDDFKPILLEKALKEKGLCETILEEIAVYGEENGFAPRTKRTKRTK